MPRCRLEDFLLAPVEDGKYSIPEQQGPTLGEAVVQISGYAAKPVAVESGEATADSNQDPDNASAGKNIVPAKYNTSAQLKVHDHVRAEYA